MKSIILTPDTLGNSGAPLENHPGIPGVKRQENDSPDGCPEPFRACPGVERDQNDYPPSGKPCNDSSDCEETLEFCNPSMGKCVTKPHFGGS